MHPKSQKHIQSKAKANGNKRNVHKRGADYFGANAPPIGNTLTHIVPMLLKKQ